MKKICILLLLTLLICPATQAAEATKNAATEANVTANISELAYPVSNAIDSSENTEWISATTPNTQYRYLRIVKNEMKSDNILEIYDVKVYATSQNSLTPTDICRNKPADGIESWSKINPSRGNDGNPKSSWFNAPCGTKELYWSVDLGENYLNHNITAVEFLLGEGYRNGYYANVNIRVELSNHADFSEPYVIYNNTTNHTIDGVQYIDLAKGPITVTGADIIQESTMEPGKLTVNLGLPTKVESVELLMSSSYASGFEVRASKISPQSGWDTLASYGENQVCTGKQTFNLAGASYTVIEIVSTATNNRIGVRDIKVNVSANEFVNVALGKTIANSSQTVSLLTDGKLNTVAIGASVYDIDLGRRYPIKQIDLVTGEKTGNTSFAGLKLLASNTPGFTAQNDIVTLKEFGNTTEGNSLYSIPLTGNSYRYLRLQAPAEKAALPLAELIVHSDTDEYTGAWMFDESSKTLSITVGNNTNIDKSYLLVVLKYHVNGKMTDIKAVTTTVLKNSEAVVSTDIAALCQNLPEGGSIKALLADNFTNLNIRCAEFIWEE